MKSVKKLKKKLKKWPSGKKSNIKRYIVSFRMVIYDKPVPSLSKVEKISHKIGQKTLLKAFTKRFDKVALGAIDLLLWDRQLLGIEDQAYNDEMKKKYVKYSKSLIAKAEKTAEKPTVKKKKKR